MPRSQRAYGDPLPKTLANAIAYAHITQAMRGLHMSTRSKLMNLYEFANNRPHYRFSDEALKLAEGSIYWTGYRWLEAQGYRLSPFDRHRMRLISFWHPDPDVGMNASMGADGAVLIFPEKGLWKDRTRRLTAEQMRAELDALQGAS